jgi:hypothetical protein
MCNGEPALENGESEADGARPKHFITDSGMGYRFENED